MKPGSWPSIGLIYLYGVATSASLSKVIPLQGDFALHLGVDRASFSLLVALLAVAPAIFAAAAGSIIDRIGSRTALIAAACVGVIANLAYLLAGSLPVMQGIRVLEGFIMVGAYSGAPALIMATAPAEQRGRAMAFWSTYTPVGFSLGLLMSAGFVGSDNWRGGYAIHLAVFLALMGAGFALPRTVRPSPTGRPRAGLLDAWGQPGPLRLSLTFGTLVMMGFGLNTVFPGWYAVQNGAPMSEASSLLALGNLVMIPGGLIAGAMLARGRRDHALLTVLMIAAALLSLPLLMPGESRVLRLLALMAWQFESGAALAVVVAGLPRVVADARQGAAAAGLLSQVSALVTFITPLVWSPILASGRWPLFVLVVAVSAVLALLLFPRGTTTAPRRR